jgi:hypothetical protein
MLDQFQGLSMPKADYLLNTVAGSASKLSSWIVPMSSGTRKQCFRSAHGEMTFR